MQANFQALEATSTALRQALSVQDWSAIGALDLQCRQAVEAAMVDATDEQQLRLSMENLLSLYKELVSVCQAEQNRLAAELVQINQAHQGAKVYQLFG